VTAHVRLSVVASLLLAACATHPRKPPVPDLAGNPAQPDCQAADYLPGKPLATTRPQEGCWNEANLARMVADPVDLVHGKPLGPANGRRETLGVETYQDGKLKTLPGQETASPSVLGVSSSSGGTP
jgi:type IV pilus biogenesis protein CpaD/CtpE